MKYFSLMILMSVTIALHAQNCLISYYPLNGNAKDEIDTTQGILKGTMPEKDRFGYFDHALYFDGTDDLVRIPNEYDLPDRSIAFWFKLNNQTTEKSTLIGCSNPTLQFGSFIFAIHKIGSDIKFQFNVGPAGTQHYVNIVKDKWYFAAMTQTPDSTKFYFDNKLVLARETQYSKSVNGDEETVLGSNRLKNGYFFNGWLDNLRFYDCAIDATEIEKVYLNSENYIESKTTAKVYPNPSSGIVNINLETYDKGDLIIYNVLGEVVYTTSIYKSTVLYQSDIGNGTFFYQISFRSKPFDIITGKIHLK